MDPSLKDQFALEKAKFKAQMELKKEMHKGNDGYTPVKGKDYFTEREIAEIRRDIQAMLKVPKDGKDAVVDYEKILRYTYNKVAELVAALPLQKGDKGDKGEKGESAVIDLDEMVRKVIVQLPKQKDKKFVIDRKQIEDLIDARVKTAPQQIVRLGASVASIRALTDVNLAGVPQDAQGNYLLAPGSVSSIAGFISAGTNVTITGSGTIADPYVINSSGGGASNLPEFYIADYGALSDGSTDDLTAIQATITAATAVGGGKVVFPSGTTKIGGRIVMADNIKLIGQGRDATILQSTASSGALPTGSMIYSSNYLENIAIQGMTILGNGKASTSGTGIRLETSSGVAYNNIILDDLYVRAFPDDGIYCDVPIISTFKNLWVCDCGRDGIFLENGTSVTLSEVYATACERAGIHLKIMTYCTFNSTACEYNTYGYWLETTRNVSMNGVGGEVAINADSGALGIVAHYRLENSQNIVVNGAYSTQFSYLSGTPAYHWYITGSQRIILNAVRGFADLLDPGDPHEAPESTMYIDGTSEVHSNSIHFFGEQGTGIDGSFKSEITTEGNVLVQDEAYDATSWNGSLEVPTKNAIRDKIENLRTVVVTSGSATMGASPSTDYFYFVAGAHTMSLPAAAANTNRYTVKNNHSANITIDTAGAETVEGAASISIAPEESVDLISNGTDWFVV
jgi:hypothetical protein